METEEDIPKIKPSLLEVAVSGPDTGTSPNPQAQKEMNVHLEEIRKDLEVSQQIVVELNKPPTEMVYVPKLLIQELQQHYESTLVVLNVLLS